MSKSIMIRKCAAAVVVAFVAMSTVLARQTPVPSPSSPQAAAKAEKAIIPLKVQVTLSRYDGEKKTSNLPFTLWVNANDQNPTSLNVGIQVPVPQTVIAAQGAQSAQTSFSYRSLGTNLTCTASALDDGRFKLNLNINDSSLAPSKDTTLGPTFQSLTTQNYLLLKDGQTAQFVAATDKITGEVTKVDVTVSVLK